MIGWRPYLLTGLAAIAVAIVALDVSSTFHASAYAGGHTVDVWLHNAALSCGDWVSHLGVLDWVLVGVAAALVAWGWVRAKAFATLGTIEISDLTTDEPTLKINDGRAALQYELGQRGWLPPSGVPGGSPTVASIADAIAKSPAPQASWLGTLIGLVPWPPNNTGFKIKATLVASGAQVQLSYELTCTGPRPCTELGLVGAHDQPSAIAAASKELYRRMAGAAPEMYPGWAQWTSSAALSAYRAGLDRERAGGTAPAPTAGRAPTVSVDASVAFKEAYAHYATARELDPANMLAYLRLANCLERIAVGDGSSDERPLRLAKALAAYLEVRLRQPSIFEAGFRASVLMSVLSSETPGAWFTSGLDEALTRLEREHARQVDYWDPTDSPRLFELIHRLVAAVRRGLRFIFFDIAGARSPDTSVSERLNRAARRESRHARRRLRPWWTVVHENRFRHRFEPRGRERRRLRKALAISRMAQRARRAGDLSGERVTRVSDLTQFAWRAWVFWRYMAARGEVAGWQAHYNAACFYSLLPQAGEVGVPFGSLRIRRRALWHLRRSIAQGGEAFPYAYARHYDPDLRPLRLRSPRRFADIWSSFDQTPPS